MEGQVPAAQVLPPDHQLGMQVPKGGSMCANCKYFSAPQSCGNEGFQAWNGSDQIPAPPDEYCCDLYEPQQGAQMAPQQPGQGPQGPAQSGPPDMMIKALQGGQP